MARVFWTFGAGTLFVAFVLQFITSISLPFLTALDIVNVDFDTSSGGKVVIQSIEPVGNVKVRKVYFVFSSCEAEPFAAWYLGILPYGQ